MHYIFDFLYKSIIMLLVLIWIALTCQGNSNEYQQHIFYKEVDKDTLALI